MRFSSRWEVMNNAVINSGSFNPTGPRTLLALKRSFMVRITATRTASSRACATCTLKKSEISSTARLRPTPKRGCQNEDRQLLAICSPDNTIAQA